MAIEKIIAQSIKERRRKLKMTQDELAAAASVDRGYISEIESGKKNFTIQILERIAQGLQITPEELMCKHLAPSVQSTDRQE